MKNIPYAVLIDLMQAAIEGAATLPAGQECTLESGDILFLEKLREMINLNPEPNTRAYFVDRTDQLVEDLKGGS